MPPSNQEAMAHALEAFMAMGGGGSQWPAGVRERMVTRMEVLLNRFLNLKQHDPHGFFPGVEPKDAADLASTKFEPGGLYRALLERQEAHEFQVTIAIGIALLATVIQVCKQDRRDPLSTPLFMLNRIVEEIEKRVSDPDDLLALAQRPEDLH